MFNYSEKTKVDLKFKISDLFKTIKADKLVKADAKNIISVILTNTLSPERTNLEASDNVKEIYVFDINLNSNKVPEQFIEALNRGINLQTLFKLKYNNLVKYIISIKQVNEDRMKVLKIFETDWLREEKQDFPITTKLEAVFKEMLRFVTGYRFRPDEDFESYTNRLATIKKLHSEIEKQTRIMNAEKQPNIRMKLNDELKQLKKQLQMLEDEKELNNGKNKDEK